LQRGHFLGVVGVVWTGHGEAFGVTAR
jgi:hypothetical protein